MYWQMEAVSGILRDEGSTGFTKHKNADRILHVPDHEDFDFLDLYRVDNEDIWMSRKLFEEIYALGNTENIKAKAVKITHCGQTEDYVEIQPSYLNCLYQDRILEGAVGRYIMFRVEGRDCCVIYVNDSVKGIVAQTKYKGILIKPERK